uniref:Protein kinase domain-containing protein n=1 Tax=Leersia perrieri TaxID=77586 RepID=A0A0D9UW28_9ORYZ
MIHHVNVVRLVGFCSEEMRRALVYEYMSRGSLDKYIFSSERSFSWDKLNEIALSIARGINYLHQGCDMQILHFDIKPHNILLDDNFVPKVADFGLAKLYPRDKSFVSDRALRGTIGYIAPEIVSRSFGVISDKSDVYSFGMLLLEMAGGRRNADPNATTNASQAYYPSWVYDHLIDQQIDGSVVDMHELERKLCLVGLWCIQMKSHDRPTMSEAIEMLEGDVDALEVPPRPFFCDGDGAIGISPPQVMDSYYLHPNELAAILEDIDGITELASSEQIMLKGGIEKCPSFSCGHLKGVSAPFRCAADPPECGRKTYELICSDTKATILIDNATYYVKEIDYDRFWVIDSSVNSSCPLPGWNHLPDQYEHKVSGNMIEVELAPAETQIQANFVRCSQEVKNIAYRPVNCASSNYSFVYVLLSTNYSSTLDFMGNLEPSTLDYDYIGSLEPSCGYLAMTPLGGIRRRTVVSSNASYEDVIKFMREGFAVRFPHSYVYRGTGSIKECLTYSIRRFRDIPSSTGASIGGRIFLISFIDGLFWSCMIGVPIPEYEDYDYIIPFAILSIKFLAVLCRFVLVPLAILTFIAHKYWKTRVAIDAVEKFLQMQQILGPMRYAYTDLTAITSHFRDRLGQGGYGSVYKGVLLMGIVQVAVKMLNSTSCNGEEFISEVSTIGKIHHVNVVRLVGFCYEEMRKALVYEYMPRGSLDKYIFSSERSFSWDKLNEIALGIARGINYLHQGCDMQILHFDIKPHNILLDDNFVPKVADFGLAKLYPRNKSFVSDRALRGTIGYIAPEMVSRSFGVISNKCDVYSFGMLLLEMAGGRRNADTKASQAYYPSLVYDQLINGQQVGEIPGAIDMHELERKLCLVGLWCIQMKSYDRPSMSEAIEMLDGDVDALQVPPRPFFCDGDGIGMLPPSVMDSYLHSTEMTGISEEDDGITELAS